MKPQADSVLVTLGLNFVDPADAASFYVPWRDDLRIVDVLPHDFTLPEGLDLAFALNGRALTLFEAELVRLQPSDGLVVQVVPRGGGGGGKNPLATVAMLALVITAPAIGGWLAGAAQGFFVGAGVNAVTYGAVAGGIATGLVMGAGALAINAVLPPPRVSSGRSLGSDALQESPNYGWGALANPTENGRPIPIVYGEKKGIAPFKAAQYISTDGDKQYLNQLYLVAEGPLDSISNFQVNDNPITNYDGVTVDVRLGTADQTVITAFNDAINEQSVGVKLSTDWHTVTLDGTATQSLGIGIGCLQGLWYATDAGGLASLSVQVEVQYRKVGDAAWSAYPVQTITAAQRSAVRRYWRFDVPVGRYEVRVRFASAPASDSRHMSDTWWEYTHEVVPDDFRLPHIACFAVKALATDQLSSSITVKCDAKRATVSVPDGNGGMVSRAASNPVWMAYDLLTHPRYGVGWPVSDIAVADFESAAAWCDTKGISGAMYYDSESDFETAVSYLGRFGRFRVVPRGAKIGCISDKPEAYPEQGFLATSANILNGTFGVSYAALADRADAWEVTWFDPDKGREVIMLPGEKYATITDRPPNVRQETLYPCTTEAQAWRWARYMDRCNRYLTRTASLKCGWDALGLNVAPGRVIQIAHDVLHHTQSARVISGTATSVRLNRPITLRTGETYQFVIRHTSALSTDTGDEMHESVLVAPVATDTTTDIITLGAALNMPPEEDAPCTVGVLGRVVRWYRVTGISRSSEFTVQVDAVEYDEAIYADEGAPPSIQPSSALPSVVGLTATIMDAVEDLVTKKVVSLAWRGAAVRWTVFARRLGSAGTPWAVIGTTSDPSYVARNIESGFVWRFVATATGNPSDGQAVDVDLSFNTPSGTLGPVKTIDGGVEVQLATIDNGNTTNMWGIF